MKAFALVDAFGIDKLRVIDQPEPEPQPDEVLVRIRAAALNHRDLDVIAGQRGGTLPLVPLSDAAGEVVAIGKSVTRFAPGDRVMPVFIQDWISGPPPQLETLPTLGGPLPGVLRELAAWPAECLVRIPSGLTDIEAATLPCAAVSAWNALFSADSLRPGDCVLVQGTGGVSLFAAQFARMVGARVIAISSSDEKLDRVRALGATHTINYKREPNWGQAARELAGGGIDCIIEVGGAATMKQSISAAKNGGRISYVGSLSGRRPDFDLGEISRKSIRLNGIRVGNRSSFEAMCRAIESNGLKPIVDSTFAFADAPSALRRLESGVHVGKICVSIP